MSLKEYFKHPSDEYFKEFAYLDPFKIIKKYSSSFKKMIDYLILNKESPEIFCNNLFECLNYVQYFSVSFQQKNLVNALMMKRSKNRQLTVKEALRKKRQEIDEDNNISITDKYICKLVIDKLLNVPDTFKFNKYTKVEDIECFKFSNKRLKSKAQYLLDYIIKNLNKDDTSNLNYIYECSINFISDVIFDEYNFLKKEYKSLIKDMILDLIIFYNDPKKEKLSKPFNSTFQKIFEKYNNRKFESLIDLDLVDEFIANNKEKIERYRPIKFKDENKNNKFMYIL